MPKILLSLLLTVFFFTTNAQVQILHCGHLIDVKNSQILEQQSVFVDGNSITKVEKGYKTEKGATIIDLKNQYVMPGLMDMHVHVEGEYDKNAYMKRFVNNPADYAILSTNIAKRTLEAGFTTVRDLGGSGVNIALRDAINDGIVPGPRIYTAGKSIAITGGHADPTNGFSDELMGNPGPEDGVANGVDECRKAVRHQIKKGVDCIKITATAGVLSLAKNSQAPQFTQDEIDAIIETANDAGVHVAAHAHGKEGMMRAVKGGITSIEHGTFMDEEVMELMVKNGTYLVATITAGRSVADSAKIEGFYPALVQPKAVDIGPKIQGTFGRAYKYGVKIAFGTDAGVFQHGLNALEFQYMVEAGMPMMEALRSATLTGAELLQLDNLGSIEKGFLADIIAVSSNPIEDPAVMMDVEFVMKDGEIYK
jgi:imidazolonepropionase-like amidohydrolase